MTDPLPARTPEALRQSEPPDVVLARARRAIAGARSCLPAHAVLASALLKLGRAAEAGELIAEAAQFATGDGDAWDGLAFLSMVLGDHERANLLWHRATEVAPRDPRFWYNLACSERSLGRLAEAEAACDRAIALDERQYPTWLLRSELRVQTADANHVRELEALLGRADAGHRARLFLGYALGKELDDLERFDEAFRSFALAAATRRARLDYDVATDERKLARIAQVYAAAGGAERAGGPGCPVDSSRFVFIVGLPRSGTTLLERILTGLPGVHSNGETDHFSQALIGAARGSGDVFARAAAADPGSVASAYARLAGSGPSAQRVIEKLPLNYLYLGAIAHALPAAHLVAVRRAPLDSCFAMYRTLFAAGYPFSYDLGDLARYYAAYDRLMAHWRSLLGERLHEVCYEELVAEPRRVAAAVAAHCGLEWQDVALEVQNNRAASLTASAAQVRRPIYGTSSGRWRHYRRHLQPLIDALRAAGIALPD